MTSNDDYLDDKGESEPKATRVSFISQQSKDSRSIKTKNSGVNHRVENNEQRHGGFSRGRMLRRSSDGDGNEKKMTAKMSKSHDAGMNNKVSSHYGGGSDNKNDGIDYKGGGSSSSKNVGSKDSVNIQRVMDALSAHNTMSAGSLAGLEISTDRRHYNRTSSDVNPKSSSSGSIHKGMKKKTSFHSNGVDNKSGNTNHVKMDGEKNKNGSVKNKKNSQPVDHNGSSAEFSDEADTSNFKKFGSASLPKLLESKVSFHSAHDGHTDDDIKISMNSDSSSNNNNKKNNKSENHNSTVGLENFAVPFNPRPVRVSQFKDHGKDRSNAAGPVNSAATVISSKSHKSSKTSTSFHSHNSNKTSFSSKCAVDELPDNVDKRGRCVRHPDVKIYKKKILGGYEPIHRTCPKCDQEAPYENLWRGRAQPMKKPSLHEILREGPKHGRRGRSKSRNKDAGSKFTEHQRPKSRDRLEEMAYVPTPKHGGETNQQHEEEELSSKAGSGSSTGQNSRVRPPPSRMGGWRRGRSRESKSTTMGVSSKSKERRRTKSIDGLEELALSIQYAKLVHRGESKQLPQQQHPEELSPKAGSGSLSGRNSRVPPPPSRLEGWRRGRSKERTSRTDHIRSKSKERQRSKSNEMLEDIALSLGHVSPLIHGGEAKQPPQQKQDAHISKAGSESSNGKESMAIPLPSRMQGIPPPALSQSNRNRESKSKTRSNSLKRMGNPFSAQQRARSSSCKQTPAPTVRGESTRASSKNVVSVRERGVTSGGARGVSPHSSKKSQKSKFNINTGRCKSHPSILVARKSKFKKGWDIVRQCPLCQESKADNPPSSGRDNQEFSEISKTRMNALLHGAGNSVTDMKPPVDTMAFPVEPRNYSSRTSPRRSTSFRETSSKSRLHSTPDPLDFVDKQHPDGQFEARVSRMPYTTPWGISGWYTGEVNSSGKPHGQGRMRAKTGNSIEGEWTNGYSAEYLNKEGRMKSGFGTNIAKWKKEKDLAGPHAVRSSSTNRSRSDLVGRVQSSSKDFSSSHSLAHSSYSMSQYQGSQYSAPHSHGHPPPQAGYNPLPYGMAPPYTGWNPPPGSFPFYPPESPGGDRGMRAPPPSYHQGYH